MLPCSHEETSAGKLLKKTTKPAAATPQARVLHQSNRHNIQTSCSNRGACLEKRKSPAKNSSASRSLKRVINIPGKQNAVSLGRHGGQSLESCMASGEAGSADSSQVDELKQRLQFANLQVAEVVAQSAILVRDVEYAASKRIADALQFARLTERKDSSDFLTNLQVLTGFDHADGSELALAVTRQQLADCQHMLAVMERQLDRTSREKEELERYLRCSVETAVKAAKERYRNESVGLVQLAKEEANLLKGQLDAAILSKVGSDGLLRNCIQLLCKTQRELVECNARKQQHCCFQAAVQEKYQQLQVAQEQVQRERDSIHEACTENAIILMVLMCVWEGAAQCSNESGSFVLDSRCNMHFETLDAPGEPFKQPNHLAQECYILSEDITPFKRNFFSATPRSSRIGEDEGMLPRFEVSLPEDALRQSLVQSEQEVEFLGDKVGELRLVLEKVTLLLDCISKSSVTGCETRVLTRRIIEQLQKFEM